ncbi:RIP metalloprotease [Chloroflexota bacterium]
MVTLVAFLGVLAVLILAHELGHFATAKAFGVKVEEFGLGFPPRIVSIKWGETRYSLNAVPLGGFIKMVGEEDPSEARSLASRGTGARLLVLGAGSMMNLLLPILLFSIAFMVPHDTVVGKVVVQEVAPGSPAASASIEPGDTFLNINGRPVNHAGDLGRYIQLNLGREIAALVEHSDGTTKELSVVPRWRPPESEGSIGVMVRTVEATIIRRHELPWQAIPMGVRECIDTFVLFKNAIVGMVIGTVPLVVTGPVGIAQMTGEVAKVGFSPLLEFAAFLSINLAIINLFPLPALDGGRMLFVLLEWVRRGKRIFPRTERLVHLVGFFMLIAAILAVTYNDIIRIINGQNLLP